MNMPFGRKSPLEALALPGIILAYKYSQFRERRREAASKRVTERELSALHSKIDKLLNKLDDTEPDPPTSQENECVICINARAVMQTSPCGHCVVCRRCFVKTIQTAVSQRLLPLRCVICRARVNRLTSISISGNSKSKSRYSDNISEYRLPSSASTSSLKSSRQARSNGYVDRHWSVSNSASLYSMTSNGSSALSQISRNSVSSKASSSSSYGLSSPCTTPVSANNAMSPQSAVSKQLLTPILNRPQRSITLPSDSQTLRGASSVKNPHHSHAHCSSCTSNCSGAVPRKPVKMQNSMQRSHTVSFSNTTTNTFPGRRSIRGRSLKSNLPPIEEFNSPAKVPHPSPVHISNPRFRYASYTKTNNTYTGFETAPPFLRETTPYFKASGSKVCPVTTKENIPKMAFINKNNNNNNNQVKSSNKTPHRLNSNVENNTVNKNTKNGNKDNSKENSKVGDNISGNSNKKPIQAEIKTSPSFFNLSTLLVNYKMHFQHNTSSSRRNLNFLFKSNHKDKTDTKNMETYELKKREEKLKQKTERETRKEEKRRTKEEERIAKATAKEDKKINKNK